MRGIATVMLILLMAGCTSVDCPLSKVEGCRFELPDDSEPLTDTISVVALRSNGSDTLLLNRFIDGETFVIPMSYTQSTDELLFLFADTLHVTRADTVRIHKTVVSHFESVDCAPTFFHHLDDIEWTRHVIDSIVISKSVVNYDTTACHLQLYIKPRH